MGAIIDDKWLREAAAAAIRERVAAELTPARLCELAEERVARLTLDQVQRVLGKTNRAQTVAFLREHKVPVVRYSRQAIYVLARDLEAVDAAHRTTLAGATAIGKAVRP